MEDSIIANVNVTNRYFHCLYFQNAHILQAVLILVKELDRDSLEIVDTAIKKRLDSL